MKSNTVCTQIPPRHRKPDDFTDKEVARFRSREGYGKDPDIHDPDVNETRIIMSEVHELWNDPEFQRLHALLEVGRAERQN
jgi:hypothetical protein